MTDLPPDAATLDRLIRTRHSCRGFKPDQVPRATIETMLRIAQGAASWCNAQHRPARSAACFVRDWFSIPDQRRIVCGISFGLADADHAANRFRTNRAPLDQVGSWVSQDGSRS